MKQKIFYINGAGGSGKDTFVDLVEKFVPVWKLSTVDEVKRIAIDHFGWDSVKDDKGRALLSAIKHAWANYNNGPALTIGEQLNSLGSSVVAVFIMVREFDEMIAMQKLYGGQTLNVWGRKSKPCKTEQAFLDSVPTGYRYDFEIDNRHSEGSLAWKAYYFATNSIMD